jgi:XTP/dITP diphosphohydrolase
LQGTGGFGYDPVFIPEGFNQTFAELDESVKNTVSHRARALKNLMRFLGH